MEPPGPSPPPPVAMALRGEEWWAAWLASRRQQAAVTAAAAGDEVLIVGGGIMGAHLLSSLSLVGNGALLRVIKAVDHVEHRALSRAIGADDRTDFSFADIKTNIHERVHAGTAAAVALP